MSDLDLDALEAIAQAAPKAEPVWPKRAIDWEGTCDGCDMTTDLVAAYDDPSGENEPWLCATCAAGSDFLMAFGPEPVLALIRMARTSVISPAAREGES